MRIPGEFIVENGIVDRIKGPTIWVSIGRSPSECAGCKACSTPALRPPLRVPVKNDGTLTIGAAVAIKRFVANPAIAALILFGIPLALGLGALVVWGLWPGRNIDSPAGFAMTTAGLIAGVVLSGALERSILPRPQAKVVAISKANSPPDKCRTNGRMA